MVGVWAVDLCYEDTLLGILITKSFFSAGTYHLSDVHFMHLLVEHHGSSSNCCDFSVVLSQLTITCTQPWSCEQTAAGVSYMNIALHARRATLYPWKKSTRVQQNFEQQWLMRLPNCLSKLAALSIAITVVLFLRWLTAVTEPTAVFPIWSSCRHCLALTQSDSSREQ